jgi:hypothetical protein
MENPFWKYQLMPDTSATAINRHGQTFAVGEEVVMVDFPVLYEKMLGQVLEIVEIYKSQSCESGYMVHAVHKETQNKFRSLLDINWFKKLHHQ